MSFKKLPTKNFLKTYFYNKKTKRWSYGQLKLYLALIWYLSGKAIDRKKKHIILKVLGIEKTQFWRLITQLKQKNLIIEKKLLFPIPLHKTKKGRRAVSRLLYVRQPARFIKIRPPKNFFKRPDWFYVLEQIFSFRTTAKQGRDIKIVNYFNKNTKSDFKIFDSADIFIKVLTRERKKKQILFFKTKKIRFRDQTFLVSHGTFYRKQAGQWVESIRENKTSWKKQAIPPGLRKARAEGFGSEMADKAFREGWLEEYKREQAHKEDCGLIYKLFPKLKPPISFKKKYSPDFIRILEEENKNRFKLSPGLETKEALERRKAFIAEFSGRLKKKRSD